MKGLIDIVVTLFGFDIVRLRQRLSNLDDPRTRGVLILFTMLADTIRFFVVTCLFVLAIR